MVRLITFIFLIGLLLAGYMGYYLSQPLPITSTPLEFSLRPGSSVKSTVKQLQQAGVIEQAEVFAWLVRLSGKSTKIKAGKYTLSHAVTPNQLLNMIAKGTATQAAVSVIEGWSFKQFRAALNGNVNIAHDTLNLTDEEILQRIGATETHAEGLFFPDTYYFSVGSSDLPIFKRAYQIMQQRLEEVWAKRDADLPLQTPYQALILASIVEKETGTANDRDKVAAVFVNRLRKGMLLQTDPTVIYGMGEKFDGNIRKRDLQIDTPYNTYTRPGLTPTPISLPGLASLQSTLHPAQIDALYFVARGDGSSEFSSNLNAHNNAVNKYQK
ncbi:MAG: endolytic transglycosylase MltG [Gallionella sp.]